MLYCTNCRNEIKDWNIEKCPKCRKADFWFYSPNRCDTCSFIFQDLIVHHVDGNHKNNYFSNKIKICRNCHARIHAGLNKRPRGRQSAESKRNLKLDKYTISNLNKYRTILLEEKYKIKQEEEDKKAVYL